MSTATAIPPEKTMKWESHEICQSYVSLYYHCPSIMEPTVLMYLSVTKSRGAVMFAKNHLAVRSAV